MNIIDERNILPESAKSVSEYNENASKGGMRTKTKRKYRLAKAKKPLKCKEKSFDGVSSEIISIHNIRNEDILLGRGKRSLNHPGNMFYRELVSRVVVQYNDCDKKQKTTLSNSVVRSIHMQGGRFLTPLLDDTNFWVEVNGLALRKKTSQALRDASLNVRKKASPARKNVGRFRIFYRERTP